MIPWIEENKGVFPPPDQALTEPDGLLCAGANLLPETLLTAYQSGIFPWYSEGDPILWWSPDQRCTLIPSDIHISRSLQRLLKKNSYCINIDSCFEAVMRACAAPRRKQQGTWITEEMIKAYCHLADLGYGHSIELMSGNKLVGGLYGISIGRIFFAESMFSSVPNASKIVLVQLCKFLTQSGFELIDCQVENPHLLSMGAKIINRRRYLSIIKEACRQEPSLSPWNKGND